MLGPRFARAVAPQTLADVSISALNIAFWPLVGLAVVAGLATLFHVGVPWHTPWRRDLPGAVLAMVLWLLAAAGLRVYLAFSGASLDGGETIYRQLSTPIAVSLWLWVSAGAVLLGAELNAEIEKRWPTGAYERYRDRADTRDT